MRVKPTINMADDTHMCECGHQHNHEANEGHHDHCHNCSCTDHHHDHKDTCGCGHHHEENETCSCGHDHNHEQAPEESKKELAVLIAGAALLILGVLLPGIYRTIVLLLAFAVVALEIVAEAIKGIGHGQVFGENFLMTIAGIGAICIGELPEGVLVFLLYRLGEYLQTKAVSGSRKSISALLQICPDRANLLKDDGAVIEVEAAHVNVGEMILVRPGERIPLDGTIISGTTQLDTAALTGESVPRDAGVGELALAGCINLSGALELRVERAFSESTASKILEMVEHASEKKAVSEKFITRFARVYTPIVVICAIIIAAFPPLFRWLTWHQSLYSALCFLAISCPCAMVISVPLSFFAGIGKASRSGILVKGGNYLEALAQAEVIAFDKTGTLTEGRFCVVAVRPAPGISETDLLRFAALAESQSTHPIAQSILAAYGAPLSGDSVVACTEEAGHGVCVTTASGHTLLCGKAEYLIENGIAAFFATDTTGATAVYTAVDGVYYGALLLQDTPKKDASAAIRALKALGITKAVMLSGDRQSVVDTIGGQLGLDAAIGQLLPEDKLEQLNALRGGLSKTGKLLYAGDGINDTPVLAAADVGIAMGGVGSDVAIETSDIVIMGDEPSKIADGIRIARFTRRIAMQNIVFSISFKILVMILSAFGRVHLWAAVLADVGVCMLCVLNTLRISRK